MEKPPYQSVSSQAWHPLNAAMKSRNSKLWVKRMSRIYPSCGTPCLWFVWTTGTLLGPRLKPCMHCNRRTFWIDGTTRASSLSCSGTGWLVLWTITWQEWQAPWEQTLYEWRWAAKATVETQTLRVSWPLRILLILWLLLTNLTKTRVAFFGAYSGIEIAGMIRIILPFRAWVDYRHVRTS